MSEKMIFLPVLVQVLLTLAAYVMLSRVKSRATAAGLVDLERRGLHADAWPDDVIKVNNNIRNQFELPVVFYVLVMVLWATGAATPVMQLLAWLFALSRVAHFLIHTGGNVVTLRRRVFSFGVLMIAVMFVRALVAVVAA